MGFLGPVKIEDITPKTTVFMKHGFLMGKSMENLQCHRIYIYIFNTYGSMAQDS